MKLGKLLVGILIAAGAILQLSVILPSGLDYCHQDQCGIYFWGAHEHDGVWHLAVAKTIFNKFPWEMPNMAGVGLQGYNYLLDLSMAVDHLILRIPISMLYFQLIPILWFGLYIFLTIKLAKVFKGGKYFLPSLLFFNLFGSSLAYLISLRNHGTIWGSSGLLSMQPAQNLLNLQFALSLLPFYLVLTGLMRNKRSLRDYLSYGGWAALTLGLKFYSGVGLFVLLGIDLLKNARKEKWDTLKKLAILILAGAATVMLFYRPAAGMSGSPLLWDPMATVNPLVEDSSLWLLPRVANNLYSYSGLRLIILELVILAAFIFLNFGTRVMAMAGLQKKSFGKREGVLTTIGITALILLLISILFVQRGVWWNTVQFLYVSLFLANLLAAEGLSRIWGEKRWWSGAAVIAIVVLTLPTNIDVARSFIRFPGDSYIPQEEIEALEVLGEQEKGVVLSSIGKGGISRGEVRVLAHSYDTAYVAAISGQQEYLSDLIQLTLTNIEYQDRQALVGSYDCRVMEEVTYLYERKDNPFVENFVGCGRQTQLIYENSAARVFKVR